MSRASIHILLHVLVPLLVAYLFFRKSVSQKSEATNKLVIWFKPFMIMLLTMAVDLDHLFSTPVFDANRCSIGFHPLHQWFIFPIYIAILFAKKTRVLALGLCIHMFLDLTDCHFMQRAETLTLVTRSDTTQNLSLGDYE